MGFYQSKVNCQQKFLSLNWKMPLNHLRHGGTSSPLWIENRRVIEDQSPGWSPLCLRLQRLHSIRNDDTPILVR